MKQTSYELFFSQEKEENRNINEFETRKLVDFKLNLSGWIADSVKLKYSKGARPEKNKCLAISEWPSNAGALINIIAPYSFFSLNFTSKPFE